MKKWNIKNYMNEKERKEYEEIENHRAKMYEKLKTPF